MQTTLHFANAKSLIFSSLLALFLLNGCHTGENGNRQMQVQSLPVLTVGHSPVTTYQEFTASIQGSQDIQIRPQVEGILDKMLVDEGAYVKKGQSLFIINDRPYREQLNNATANLAAAKASLSAASINVEKLKPLVKGNVISDVQLKTATASYDASSANVSQAEAMVQNAKINLGYTTIISPVDGYIGHINFKPGSLVSATNAEPITMVSAVKDVYAYFSFSERDFLKFKDQFKGNTIEEKIKNMPAVELLLADNTVYPQKGKVENVSGQFNSGMGTISFRAIFPNDNGLLRSGNTGKIRIPQMNIDALIVPQEATFELQDKVFVFVLADSNKVVSTPIHISGRSGNYYLVDKGLSNGQKIVCSGLDRLKDGAVIKPEGISMDSLLKSNPL